MGAAMGLGFRRARAARCWFACMLVWACSDDDTSTDTLRQDAGAAPMLMLKPDQVRSVPRKPSQPLQGTTGALGGSAAAAGVAARAGSAGASAPVPQAGAAAPTA